MFKSPWHSTPHNVPFPIRIAYVFDKFICMVIMEAEHIKNTGTTGTTGTPPTPTTPLSTVNFPQNNSKPTLSNRFELNRCGAPLSTMV